MKEVVSINVGQAGVQLSNAAWELFCMEHAIRADGSRLDILDDGDEKCEIFFQALKSTFVPRVISVDFEPTVIDEIRVGAYRQLFHPDQLISGCEDCANNFARGNFTVGKIYLKTVMKQVVKLVENCDALQGFCILNSFDGGTGAGFSSCLEDALSFHYGKKPKFQLGIYPSRRMATCIVYPYNAVFHTHTTMDHTDLGVLMDNEAIYNICSNKLNLLRPSYNNINRIIAQLFSSITVSMRFKNFLNSDIDQICTNLIPYPRIHFPLSHLAPLLGADKGEKEQTSISEITRDIFEPENQLVQCDTENGRFMACVMQFRGPVSPNEVNKAIHDIKRRTDIKFVDWCPTGFKVGINNKPLASPPGCSLAQIQKSLMMLSNTSAIVETWSDLLRKFNAMFNRRAFIHWFIGEGLEEGEFSEAYDNILSLERDYLEVSEPSNEILIEIGEYEGSRKSRRSTQERQSNKSRRSTKEMGQSHRSSRKLSSDSNEEGETINIERDPTIRSSRKASSGSKERQSTTDRKQSKKSKLSMSQKTDRTGSVRQSTRLGKSDSEEEEEMGNQISANSRRSTKRSSVGSKGALNDEENIARQSTRESTRTRQSSKKGSAVSKGGEDMEDDPVNLSKQNTRESSHTRQSSRKGSAVSKGGEDMEDDPVNLSKQNTRESSHIRQSSRKGSVDTNAGLNAENQSLNMMKPSSKESASHRVSVDSTIKGSINAKDGLNVENQSINMTKQSSKESSKSLQSSRKTSLNSKGGEYIEGDPKKESTNTRQSSKKGSVMSKIGENLEEEQTSIARESSRTHQSTKKGSTDGNGGLDIGDQAGNISKQNSKESNKTNPSIRKLSSNLKSDQNIEDPPIDVFRLNTKESTASHQQSKIASSDSKRTDNQIPNAASESRKDSNITNENVKSNSLDSQGGPLSKTNSKESKNPLQSIKKVFSGLKSTSEEKPESVKQNSKESTKISEAYGGGIDQLQSITGNQPSKTASSQSAGSQNLEKGKSIQSIKNAFSGLKSSSEEKPESVKQNSKESTKISEAFGAGMDKLQSITGLIPSKSATSQSGGSQNVEKAKSIQSSKKGSIDVKGSQNMEDLSLNMITQNSKKSVTSGQQPKSMSVISKGVENDDKSINLSKKDTVESNKTSSKKDSVFSQGGQNVDDPPADLIAQNSKESSKTQQSSKKASVVSQSGQNNDEPTFDFIAKNSKESHKTLQSMKMSWSDLKGSLNIEDKPENLLKQSSKESNKTSKRGSVVSQDGQLNEEHSSKVIKQSSRESTRTVQSFFKPSLDPRSASNNEKPSADIARQNSNDSGVAHLQFTQASFNSRGFRSYEDKPAKIVRLNTEDSNDLVQEYFTALSDSRSAQNREDRRRPSSGETSGNQYYTAASDSRTRRNSEEQFE